MMGINTMKQSIEWRNDYLVLSIIILVALVIVLLPGYMPVQAAAPDAPSAPPEVKPCQEINTATLPNGGVITIFYCEPDNSIPYKINSLGFMLNEE